MEGGTSSQVEDGGGLEAKSKTTNTDGGGGQGACNPVAALGEETGRGGGEPEVGVVRSLEEQSLAICKRITSLGVEKPGVWDRGLTPSGQWEGEGLPWVPSGRIGGESDLEFARRVSQGADRSQANDPLPSLDQPFHSSCSNICPISAEDPGAPGSGRSHTACPERRGSDLPQPNPRAGKMVSKDRFLSGILPGRGSMGSEGQLI